MLVTTTQRQSKTWRARIESNSHRPFEACGFCRRRCRANLQCPGCGVEFPGSSPGFSDALYRRAIEDGGIEIDHNAAERSLRGVALGRKNYLFAGSDAGGERAAAMYSLIGSAKLNGLDPEAYLRQVLVRIRGPSR
jgi:hypothetical protein